MFSVKFDGALFDGEVTKRSEEAIEDALLFGALVIQEKTPIKSGALAAGWDFDKQSIFNEVPYTDYIENGTTKIAPRYMVKSSVPVIEEKILDNLIKVING